MSNNYLLSMPIKAINVAVKAKLTEKVKEVQFESKGIIYKNNYFDFKVSKAVKENFELYKNLTDDSNYIIHVNQIKDEEIFLSIVFEYYIECFILDKRFIRTAKKFMSFQHHKQCYQLHVAYSYIKQNALKVEMVGNDI